LTGKTKIIMGNVSNRKRSHRRHTDGNQKAYDVGNDPLHPLNMRPRGELNAKARRRYAGLLWFAKNWIVAGSCTHPSRKDQDPLGLAPSWLPRRGSQFFPKFFVPREVVIGRFPESDLGVQNWKPQGADHSQAAAALPDLVFRMRREYQAAGPAAQVTA
jgi:hypothetical protein